tara:strand:+ start:713 stop:1213 length:501 start_codon:yes stop_codon:yes gene_type:complete
MSNNNKIAVYPGSFDPFTLGHLDVVRRGSKIFNKLIVAVAENNSKNSLFKVSERTQIISDVLKKEENISSKVEVKSFSGLLVDFVESENAIVVLRGLRALSDFDYEFQMAGVNARLSNKFETMFLMSSENQQFVASRLVKEIHRLGGDVSSFVPDLVNKFLNKKNN